MTIQQIQATELLQALIAEASQILEVSTFRESQIFELGQSIPHVEARWKRDFIKAYEAGNEGDPEPTAEEISRYITKGVMGELRLSSAILNSASLVLIHSFFDAFLSDLLQVTSIVGPEIWRDNVKLKKISVESVLVGDTESALDDVVKNELKDLDRQSIDKRMNALIAICKSKWTKVTDREFSPVVIANFSLDLEKLKTVDEQRQAIIHKKAMDDDIQSVINDYISVMWFTLINSIQLVSVSFGLPVDLAEATKARNTELKLKLVFKAENDVISRMEIERS